MKRGISSFSREKVYHRTLYSYYSRFHSLSVILSLPPSLCVCKYTHTRVYSHMHVYLYLCIHIYMCVHVCAYISPTRHLITPISFWMTVSSIMLPQ